ncbi:MULTISPECIES: CRISPR-associated endonuclease Cas2 [Nitrosomonas]|uniref:CRISPR-associated endoribonuclease Cas2 n=2 Tax=Nitrosomonas eutropha TaxID=916 RepID=A0ABX5M4Y9_9PROT|nr:MULTISPECIES: CRISPR-associated endonuclease Cas2 [Nitrosomonas]ABI60448.1 CRISPR-associated protein, Cas2 family [Nitrosomonas eutropha C91]MXS81290.1 CRISPR-associated endonuclease Cas2 [Nitrosomonas sp. GH22]PXV77783.1 CRISPR-associated Cas2 family protein [Nitrosomonas eutropha]SDX05605.1 CRISPR-associated protein, Cas2 family [Nitrosomonas eutropha]SEJ17232.1 CRISPR-associated protein, Cas2 family [Nitrosomonas eutropha]
MSDFIICYDITHPRRLARLHRYLVKRAVPLQYSVFLFSGDDRQLEHCMQGAIELIDEKVDDLRVYPLPSRGLKARIGQPALPEGIQWSGLPTAW